MTRGTYRLFLVFSLTALLAFPAIAGASNAIILTAGEKKLVDQGDVVVREVNTLNKSGRTFEAIGLINAPKNIIRQVLATYEEYPEFMPNVSQIEILEQKDNEAILNYTLSLPLGKVKKYRLKIVVTGDDKQPAMLEWRLEKWPGLKAEETIKDTTGYWLIREMTQNSSLVLYHVYTDPGPVPFGLGWIIDVLSKNSVPKALSQTKARSEKIARD